MPSSKQARVKAAKAIRAIESNFIQIREVSQFGVELLRAASNHVPPETIASLQRTFVAILKDALAESVTQQEIEIIEDALWNFERNSPALNTLTTLVGRGPVETVSTGCALATDSAQASLEGVEPANEEAEFLPLREKIYRDLKRKCA
jgi:hypothetical protein